MARKKGKLCVRGTGALSIDYATETLTVDGQAFKEGDFLSSNGIAGNVYAGELMIPPVGFKQELDLQAEVVRRWLQRVAPKRLFLQGHPEKPYG